MAKRPLNITDLRIGGSGELYIKFVTDNPTMARRPRNLTDLSVDENGSLLVTTDSLPASGVQSISGDLVDNTDPANPIINTPTAEDVGADPTGSAEAVQDNLDAYQVANDATVAGKLTATQGAAQADSTAEDVPGIVTDFNTLLANLRNAGIIAT